MLNFTDSERLNTPKTDCVLKVLQDKKVYQLGFQVWRPWKHRVPCHLKQKLYNFITNTLKAYLSAQASSLSAFMISKTHTSGQKPRGRQLNAKVRVRQQKCDFSSSFFQTTITGKRLKYSLTLILARNWCSSECAASQPLNDFIDSNSPWSIKAFHNTLSLLSVVKDAIFSFCTHAHTKSRSQVKYHAHWSGNDTKRNRANAAGTGLFS